MSYYICPLHTLWTLFIYVSLGVFRELNESRIGITLKFGFLLGAVALVWHNRFLWDILFSPFRFVLRYRNPHYPDFDEMQEWWFRSSLDRFVWIFGMFCAYNFPNFERAIVWVESQPRAAHFAIKGVLVAVLGAMCWIYYTTYYVLPKEQYNAVHPYTSFFPIAAFLILRNITPWLRKNSNHVFGWLGKITLETYILQYHVWLGTGRPNHQPKQLLVMIPDYPLLNYTLVSLTYIFVSNRAFILTVTLRDAVIPKTGDGLLKNMTLFAVSALTLFTVGAFVRHMT
eukprot:c13375_g1_i1.p2 GENE.c13375_g1_i1~~c13375_g1_i1.p2  ORF type:complete len:285 (+),score=61.59 c13375_g1_i1:826-1680(+)